MPVNGHAKTHIDGADMLCEKLPLVVIQIPLRLNLTKRQLPH